MPILNRILVLPGFPTYLAKKCFSRSFLAPLAANWDWLDFLTTYVSLLSLFRGSASPISALGIRLP